MRVFLDANVLFAAAISPEGRSAALFLVAEHRFCILLSSAHAVTEARRNLEGRYADALERFEPLTRRATIVPEAAPQRVDWSCQQSLPNEDAPILAAAIDADADVLVTGDRKHFGHLFGRTLGGVRVLGLAETLTLVLEQKRRK
jgi:predicted nucleic acid-binding protein